MKNIQVHQVDVFTDKLFEGNPATVVFDANRLSEQEMKDISAEMNNDETAFALPPENSEALFRLKFYTPNGTEIPFTGHATVGTLYEMARFNMYGLGNEGMNSIKIETGAGILEISTEVTGNRIFINMGVPKMDFEEYPDLDIHKRLGISKKALAGKIPIIYEKKLKYLYIPIHDLEELGKLKFDFTHIKKTFKDENITIFCFYTNEGFSEDTDIHSRVIAPLIGFTAEDSFTGSTQAVICSIARKYNFIDKDKSEYNVEQGHFINMKGSAKIRFEKNSPYVKSTGVHVFTAEINIK